MTNTEETMMTDTTEAPAPAEAAVVEAPEYAIVEIMGHRRLVGRIIDTERFGAKLLRIDVPTNGDFDQGFTSQFYAGSAIFSVTPTDLATVRRMNKPYESARLYSAPRAPFVDDTGDGGDGDDA